MTQARPDVVALSRDSVWAKEYLSSPNNPWPAGGDAWVKFYSTQGALLAQIDADSVEPTQIRFIADPEDVNDIPAGANFEVHVDTEHGPVMIRYGRVLRKESRFYFAAATELSQAMIFTDSFQKRALGNRWERVFGGARIYDNAGSLPNGAGHNLLTGPAGIRFWRQTTTDSWEISVQMVFPLTPILNTNDGRYVLAGGCDVNMTSGIGLEINTTDNIVQLVRFNGQKTVVALGDSDAFAFNNTGQVFTIRYNNLTKTLTAFYNEAPLLDPWVDEDNEIPKGNGFRHLTHLWLPASTWTLYGPQVAEWAAKDIV